MKEAKAYEIVKYECPHCGYQYNDYAVGFFKEFIRKCSGCKRSFKVIEGE